MGKGRWENARKSIKKAKRHRRLVVIALIVLIAVSIPTLITRQHMNYSSLLNTIAKGESKGNYNAYYGNAGNTTVQFTSMSVREVIAWQKEYVKNGSPSSAAGKYQIIRPTLEGLVKEHGIDENAKFDEELQDMLAIKLLERRGIDEYSDGKISREQFAHNLSKEWAALPKTVGDRPDESYYAGDGINKVRVSIGDVLGAIDTLKNSE